ncbi:MAG: hypothetical protein AB7D05_08460 [Mangrovibacterium sp.]
MKKLYLPMLVLLMDLFLFQQLRAEPDYLPLNPADPVAFCGDHFVYHGKKTVLGPRAFFIDGQLSDEEAGKYPYVFNSVNEAVKQLADGTEEIPMVLYLAPWVYWIDDPDDPEIRVPKSGRVPFGLDIDCEWLKFYGLSEDPRHVVLACNRGQTMGAKGNFTLFRISGEGTAAENVTFGNYCNIDLEYSLKPEFDREKRGSAIVQAQLVFCDGDKLYARNCRFVSRLNLNPFFGAGKRALFDRCHFESTDDALNKTAVYMNCTLDFYGSKPFGSTTGTGAVFLNCDLRSFVRGEQYFTKVGGQVAAVDTRMKSETAAYWGWKDFPPEEARCYQYRVCFNGDSVFIGNHHPVSTVDMGGKAILDAYRIEYDGGVIYNTYNLLQGDDDWDPAGVKEQVLAAEKEHGKNYTHLPVQLLVSSTRDTLETGKDRLVLQAVLNRFGSYPVPHAAVKWSIAPGYGQLAELRVTGKDRCELIPENRTDSLRKVVVKAVTASGLEGAAVFYVIPQKLDPPLFAKTPELRLLREGKLRLDYRLDTEYADQSLISWYRCRDARGSEPVEVAVSRMNDPRRYYTLTAGDVGCYLMASVSPKHLRSDAGEPFRIVLDRPVLAGEVKTDPLVMNVDLKSLSTRYQPEIRPGYWSMDCYKPADTREQAWVADNSTDAWYYGPGINGAAGDTGIVQHVKGARMRFTPVGEAFGDMKIRFTAVPAKTAGQGFSSATDQYMDVYIKFDHTSMNGYALRLIRTTKYHDAIDFVLVKYEKGKVVPISDPVSTSCYRGPCHIMLESKGNNLIVHAETPADYYHKPGRPEVKPAVDMKTEITPNPYGGMGFQHTGTVRSGATLIKDLKIEWAD